MRFYYTALYCTWLLLPTKATPAYAYAQRRVPPRPCGSVAASNVTVECALELVEGLLLELLRIA